MADNVTNELILEHLKVIQSKLAEHDNRFERIELRISDIESHISTMKTDLATLVGGLSRIDQDHDILARRVDRIERRLEISDGQ